MAFDALVFGPSPRHEVALEGRATRERASSAFCAIGDDTNTRLVAAPDVATELKLGVGAHWSEIWASPPVSGIETHLLRARTEVWGVRVTPGVILSKRAVQSASSSRAHRDFLRAPRHADRAVEAMRVAEHVLSVSRIEPRVVVAMRAAEQGASSVEELADLGRVTPRHLGRLFDAVLGISPQRALALVRLRRALHLSRASSSSWGSIAADAGYADQSHMGRAFRALLGTSPEAFARATSMG